MIRQHGVLDVEVAQEVAAGAGILGQYQIGLTEYPQGSHRDVFEVAHGCGYKV